MKNKTITSAKDYKLLLIGNPNVGKSLLFSKLTGEYANVSNYPGTTVDIMKGNMRIGHHHNISIIDTPGLYNISSVTEEERVTKKIIFDENPDLVLHVIDAKNITRMLPLTIQLIETGLKVILVLNMYDELTRAGLSIEVDHLEHDLKIPIVVTAASKNEGIDNLKARIIWALEDGSAGNKTTYQFEYSSDIEDKISKIEALLDGRYNISKRAISILLLENDKDALELIKNEKNFAKIKDCIDIKAANELKIELNSLRHKETERILEDTFIIAKKTAQDKIRTLLDKLTMNPISSFVIASLVLYLGFYKFVGGFGADYLVGIIEEDIFEKIINPYADSFFHFLFGDSIFFSLFAGDYGIITLGIRYAFAIVLPIVFTFFMMFSVLEDSGYLPRLSMTLDNLLKRIGLSGRSLIPIILGLGCGTMATVVTRTLETVRERLIVTFLLALAIPCAAQMGVITGILAIHPSGFLIWFVTIASVFFISGKLMDKFIKGERPSFFMELPPLRVPSIYNIFIKTITRMKWYALEIIPVFMMASVIIWVGKITGIFDILTSIIAHPANWAGLPNEMGEIFLYGFFRRDFGAAGLYDLHNILSARQLVVSTVILTLFVPCIAQLSVMIKERGMKTALFIFASVIPFAFLVGIILNKILIFVGYL